MTIEVARFISQLNIQFPRPTDLLKEGDDHIRMIKNSLKQTFPAITGAVNATHTQFNDLFKTITPASNGIRFDQAVSFANGVIINANSNQIKLVADPTASTDAANKKYVDTIRDRLYPIGSVYISIDSRNPKDPTLIGWGDWELTNDNHAPIKIEGTSVEVYVWKRTV